jgi:quercetin dioxygenase-like cupin family protein
VRRPGSESRAALQKTARRSQCARNVTDVSLAFFDAAILDTYIPRCRRLTQLHFGRIVSNPDAAQAFSENVGYNMTFNLVEPFKGNALHTHPAVEVFIALDGRWEIAWGERGAQSTVLEPWDLVAVPADVRHSYKNVESHTAQNIMTILPGKASIVWAPAVVSEARTHGAHCTDDGVRSERHRPHTPQT